MIPPSPWQTLTWSGGPHLVAQLGGVRRADPGSGTGVERSRAVVLRPAHVRAVGAQHVWVGVRGGVHPPSSRGQVQEAAAAAADPQPQRAQPLRFEGLLQPGALPPLSAGRRGVGVPGGGVGGGHPGGVEGGRRVRVQRGLDEGAAAPGGGRGAVGRAQGVAGGSVQQLEVAEEAGGGEHLSDCGGGGQKEAIRLRFGEKATVGVRHSPEPCL